MGDQGFLKQKTGYATTAIHAGQDPDQWDSKAVVVPIVTATTFKQPAPAEPKVRFLLNSRYNFNFLTIY